MKCLILIWMLEEQHQTNRKTNILCGNLQFVLVWLLSDFRNDCWWLRHNARFSFLLLLSNPTVTIYYCGPTVLYTVHNILIPWMLRNHLKRLRKKKRLKCGKEGNLLKMPTMAFNRIQNMAWFLECYKYFNWNCEIHQQRWKQYHNDKELFFFWVKSIVLFYYERDWTENAAFNCVLWCKWEIKILSHE